MTEWLYKHLTACSFKSYLGMECPGCGMQRAFISLLKGDLIQSFQYHPALIPFLITIAALLIQLKLKHPKGGNFVMWLFIITTTITVINFVTKQYLIFNAR
jgi:hypothetical protein